MRVESLALRVEGPNRRPVRSRLALRPLTSGSPPSALRSPLRSGLTLIELLIVIIILTTLVSAAIPIMAPTNDDRRLREASRGVNAFISAAQMKAIQIQRPFGVAIKRLSKDTNSNITPTTDDHEDNAVSVELYYVEQPAPYRGFDRTSAAMVARHTVTNKTGQALIRFVARNSASTGVALPTGWDVDLFPPSMIRPGDVIEIDGTQYVLLAPDGDSPNAVTQSVEVVNGAYKARSNAVIIEARPLNDTGQMMNVEFDHLGRRLRDPILTGPSERDAPYWTNPAPYKILRQPMPTSAEPFQMPEGTALDLRASGVGLDDYFYVPGEHDNSEGIIIMFAPEGRVSRVMFNVLPIGATQSPPVLLFDESVTDNLFLLVGRRENAPPPAVGTDPTLALIPPATTEQQLQELKETVNWLRGESRWIVIGSQSGRVVTTENAFVSPQAIYNLGDPPKSEVMRNTQIKASREFAREMVQLGGR